jgi:hypothetical protein
MKKHLLSSLIALVALALASPGHAQPAARRGSGDGGSRQAPALVIESLSGPVTQNEINAFKIEVQT